MTDLEVSWNDIVGTIVSTSEQKLIDLEKKRTDAISSYNKIIAAAYEAFISNTKDKSEALTKLVQKRVKGTILKEIKKINPKPNLGEINELMRLAGFTSGFKVETETITKYGKKDHDDSRRHAASGKMDEVTESGAGGECCYSQLKNWVCRGLKNKTECECSKIVINETSCPVYGKGCKFLNGDHGYCTHQRKYRTKDSY